MRRRTARRPALLESRRLVKRVHRRRSRRRRRTAPQRTRRATKRLLSEDDTMRTTFDGRSLAALCAVAGILLLCGCERATAEKLLDAIRQQEKLVALVLDESSSMTSYARATVRDTAVRLAVDDGEAVLGRGD